MDGLWAAMKAAHDGDTILMAPGAYATLRIDSANVVGNVNITSLDPSHPATIAGLNITNSSGFSFSNVEVTVNPNSGFALYLVGDNHLSFDHMNLHGAAIGDNNAATVRSSDTISITNSNIHDLQNGIVHQDSTHLNFSNNTFHAIQTDGIHGGGSSYVTISGNTFTDFHPGIGDHPDAIQFWTVNTSTSAHDLTITNNTFVRGTGDPIQGIFMGNENHITYQNVTITGNAIVGGMYQGILLDQTDNANVSNNLVEGYQDQNSWIMLNNATRSTEANNVATTYQASGNIGLTETNDVQIIQGTVGDTSLLTSFQATHTTASLNLTGLIAPPSTGGTTTTTSTSPTSSTIAGGPTPTIVGTSGADHIVGTSGNDVIDSGAGPDTVSGGLGNDIYIVADSRDVIVESFNGGVDTIRTSLSTYTLGYQLDNLTLTSTGPQTGTGNELNNVLTDNGSHSILSGVLGNDTLVSGGGTDTMTGGSGNDVFRFDKAPSAGPGTITDFSKGADQINLHNLLTNYHGTNPVADHWVQFVDSTNGIVVSVDADGPTGAGGFTAVAVLTGVHSSLTAGTDWIF